MSIKKIVVQVTVHGGAELAAKDRNLLGKKTSSDPFCEVWKVGKDEKTEDSLVGATKTQHKTLEPQWDETFVVEFFDKEVRAPYLLLKVFDEDLFSKPDSMGSIKIRVAKEQGKSTEWYDIPKDSATNASGRLRVTLDTALVFSKRLIKGNQFPLQTDHVQVGLAWDMLQGRTAVDLDVSCVSISQEGKLLMTDTVYYGNVANSNESVLHSGDETVGDEEGDDEKISFDLRRMPDEVLCMYIVLTVATTGMQITDIDTTTMTVYDTKKRYTLCKFTPPRHALSENATAMFMVRIARSSPTSKKWILATIEDTHPTARDFGSLIPYCKSYSRDLLKNIEIDPAERVAIMRKGGNVRLSDYTPGGKLPEKITFGLAWDVTDGINIDLDASVICLDKELNCLDTVFYDQLQSKDGSIVHNGDESKGEKIGDDETIDIVLDRVNPDVQYIAFVINSYSGQELDDIDRASCRLFDTTTGTDMVTYAMSNNQSLDGFTALLLGCLYRGDSPDKWCIYIFSDAAVGKSVKDNVEDLQKLLRTNPVKMPDAVDPAVVVERTMPDPVPLLEDEGATKDAS